MTMTDLPLQSDDLRLIAEIGFIGAECGQVSAARALFEGLRELRPDSTLPFIGLAMADMGSNRAADAVRMLREEALKAHPDDPELMTFLGWALQGAKQASESHKVLSAVVARDPSASNSYTRMAAKLLESTSRDASPASLMPRWSETARRSAQAQATAAGPADASDDL